jgi:DNA mismatch repair protein MutS
VLAGEEAQDMNDVFIPKDATNGSRDMATPMIAQYLEIKAANPGCLLFYRMGDFYELFFDDAAVAAETLGIALTRRGRHQGADIPMCGVPVHSADQYLQRLIRAGHRVAICEQMESPLEARKRGSKSVVKRSVTRLVTPGTLTEDSLLDARKHNYIATLAQVRSDDALGLAWADISSGDFAVMPTSHGRLLADLAGLEPGEILVGDSLAAEPAIAAALKQSGGAITILPASRLDSGAGERRLKEHFGVATLDGFAAFSRGEVAALGGLLDYLVITQAGRAPYLRPPRRESAWSAMIIDAATRTNLELTRTLSGEARGSLLASIDCTITAAGARLLACRLAQPLTDVAVIGRRLDAVSFFAADGGLRASIRVALRSVPDFVRALSRLNLDRGGPRDLASLRDGLTAARAAALCLSQSRGVGLLPPELSDALDALAPGPEDLVKQLGDVLGEELPLLARDGGFVRASYSVELDNERRLRDETRQVIANLQSRYAEETGIRSLKIRHNNVLGYFVEVTAQNAGMLANPPLSAKFFHRQTIANAVRFTTAELGSLEQRIAAAAGRALSLEQSIFDSLCRAAKAETQRIAATAEALATVDVAAALAELTETRGYVRPRIDDSLTLDIQRGRHAVVETMLDQGEFIANDCLLSVPGKRLWILTGPNMAGKSTFLRQNALIVIMAQIGSYVPAAQAHIGIVDRLFSRVGAADDLARGRSTFMVEMVETAAILNQATERSFVILDEIGRGTATFDGLSIAWAAIEHLHDANRCRSLFATHYHELTALAGRLGHVANATMKVREWRGDVIFLHEMSSGVADRSYGIQVAKLAGLPQSVIARANEVLSILEKSNRGEGEGALLDDLPLFSAAAPSQRRSSASPVIERLAALKPDELTPRQALEVVYDLKALVNQKD